MQVCPLGFLSRTCRRAAHDCPYQDPLAGGSPRFISNNGYQHVQTNLFLLCTHEEEPESEDIADAIAVLVSTEFRWATGERIEVSGGVLL